MVLRTLCVSFLSACLLLATGAQTTAKTFHNPLLPSGPDPWVVTDGGYYYFLATTGRNLTIRRTRDLAELATAETKVVWTPPATGPYSKEIWAPELHRFDGKWYLYFAADSGTNETHRIFALENGSTNPLEGTWTFKGKVADSSDKWAIDATAFELQGQKYLLWSGWEGDHDGEQRIYIAHLRNPWTIDSPRTTLSFPKYPWEQVGDLPDRPAVPHVNVNEGPEILQHNGRTFLVYSGSACWTDYYELGLLELKQGGDPLRADAWTKLDHPVFQQDAKAGVYGPGHNGFFRSLDGREDWIVYHANGGPHEGCGAKRSPRMQRLQWQPNGLPYFGTPASTGTELARPSGSK